MDYQKIRFSKAWRACVPVILLSLILLPCFAVTGCGRGEDQAKDLRVGVLSGDMRQLPYYIAREKGFFSDAGLEVEKEILLGTGAELMSAFTAGQIDIGYVDLGSPVTFAGRDMADVRALAQSSRGGSALVVKSGLEASDIKELKDQRVGIPGRASLEDYLLKTALKKAKMTVDDIKIVEIRPYDMVSYLSAGSIEAFMGFVPYPGTAQADGAGRIIITSDKIEKNISSSLLVIDSSFADKNPDTVKKIKSAHEKAIEFIRENPAESADLGNLETNTGGEASAAAMEDIRYGSVIDRASLEEYAGFLKDIGVIDVDAKDFVKRFVMDVK